jgi:hypothetical protein
VQCRVPGACPGRDAVTGATDGCNSGWVGVACDRCAAGYYDLNGVCAFCDGDDALALVDLILRYIGLLAVFGAFVVVCGITHERRLMKAALGVVVLQKIGVLYQQTAIEFSGSFRWLSVFLSYLSALNFDIRVTKAGCGIFPSADRVSEFFVTLAVVFIMTTLVCVCVCVCVIISTHV